MDVQTCIEKYIQLWSAAFTPKRSKANLLGKWRDEWEVDGAYHADVLVEEIRQVVKDNLQDGDPEARLFDPDPVCKVLVVCESFWRHDNHLLVSQGAVN